MCSSNLRQVGLAVNLYVDDTDAQPGVNELTSGRYVPPGPVLLCPEDKTANWGYLLQSPPQPVVLTNTAAKTFSYLLHPLRWDSSLWKRVMRPPNSVGLAACELHGLGKQDISDVRNFKGSASSGRSAMGRL